MRTIIFVWALLLFTNVHAQETIKKFEFKKGEVLDILVLSTVENYKELFENYKKTAFPIAFEYTYQPQPGFRIEKLTLGNNKADNFIFGKWSNKEKREGFISNIAKRLPDFHQQRRGLFTYFGLAYYEMSKDIKFSINIKKYNVVTSFWQLDSKSLEAFYKNWHKLVIASGGRFILQLEDATSPLGYVYDPDILCIVEWETAADFETFEKRNPLSKYTSLKDVHQFTID